VCLVNAEAILNDLSGKPQAAPSLIHNYVSWFGTAIAVASLCSIVLLVLIELSGQTKTAYLGIFAYVLLPACLILSLVVIVAGMLLERRRRRKFSPAEIAKFPRLDFNNPASRRAFFVFLGCAMIFVFMSAFGSYRAFEHTESVEFCGQTCHQTMKPEFVAYGVSSHARVRCVECHVGSGAEGYARSKITGAYQLYAIAFNKVPKPILTPVHSMPSTRDTCEGCHWPAKFNGSKLKTFSHYAYDEQNTLRSTRLLINVGGGDPATGPVAGIHWHMNLANEITFIAADDRRQVIPWVQVKDKDGNITEYVDRTRPPSTDLIASGERRRMNCIDCHNRPAHTYLPPDVAVDRSFAAGRLDTSLPFFKREAVAALSSSYVSTDEAVSSISAKLGNFYRTNYGALYSEKAGSLQANIQEIQRIYQTYFFPEMKTDWSTHPNNIGHFYSSGCFRCHDGEHVSNTGKLIRNDCNICHTVLFDSARPAEKNASTGSFQHPVDLGGLADRKCESCHQANKPFQHPINLGDISMFQCVECHPKKQ
jgi:hypothetical protein